MQKGKRGNLVIAVKMFAARWRDGFVFWQSKYITGPSTWVVSISQKEVGPLGLERANTEFGAWIRNIINYTATEGIGNDGLSYSLEAIQASGIWIGTNTMLSNALPSRYIGAQ